MATNKDNKLQEAVEGIGLNAQEDVIKQEYSLMEGLLAAASYKNDEDLQKKIEIKRGGKFLFAFYIHPISEQDINACRKKATKMLKNPNGKHLPMIEGDTNYSELRSRKIVMATTQHDADKIWNNPDLKAKFSVREGWEMVDILLTGGEKSAVDDVINEISGYNTELSSEEEDKVEFAKN